MAISSQKQQRQKQPTQKQAEARLNDVSTAVRIRLFGPRDYEAVVAVNNAVFPDRPSTTDEWRYDDEHFDKKYFNERYVAEHAETGEILGFAGFWHVPWAFHPRKFGMEVRVRPDAGGAGPAGHCGTRSRSRCAPVRRSP